MLLVLIFALTAIVISALCSIWEVSLLSITPSFVAHTQASNPKLYAKLSTFKNNLDTPLAAILTLNTIANTVGAAGVGAKVAAVYGQASLGIASAIMTLAVLVLSEILPKSITAKYWKHLVSFTCASLTIIIFILKPVLYISDYMMGLFASSNDTSTLKEEIKALSSMAESEKIISRNQYKLVSNILNLSEVRATDVMTPRTVVISVEPGMTIKEFDKILKTSPFSRFPIIDEKAHIFKGYIHKSSSFEAKDTDVVDKYAHTMRSFDPETKLEGIMSSMLKDRNHMSLVVDSYNNLLGIITLEDIIETIIGKEIIDETDTVADMRLYAKLKWKRKTYK